MITDDAVVSNFVKEPIILNTYAENVRKWTDLNDSWNDNMNLVEQFWKYLNLNPE